MTARTWAAVTSPMLLGIAVVIVVGESVEDGLEATGGLLVDALHPHEQRPGGARPRLGQFLRGHVLRPQVVEHLEHRLDRGHGRFEAGFGAADEAAAVALRG